MAILKQSNGQQRMNTILKLQGRPLVMSCKLVRLPKCGEIRHSQGLDLKNADFDPLLRLLPVCSHVGHRTRLNQTLFHVQK